MLYCYNVEGSTATEAGSLEANSIREAANKVAALLKMEENDIEDQLLALRDERHAITFWGIRRDEEYAVLIGEIGWWQKQLFITRALKGENVTKTPSIPYSGGSKPDPKLTWNVRESITQAAFEVILVIDGTESPRYGAVVSFKYGWVGFSQNRTRAAIERAKATIMARYELAKEMSG